MKMTEFHENLIYRLVKRGLLTKPKECENCQKKGHLHGHHPDYLQPLHVVWLCPACHGLVHRILRRSGVPFLRSADAAGPLVNLDALKVESMLELIGD